MKAIISYRKHRGTDGTVYNQLVKIDKDLKEKYNDILQKEYDRIEKKEKDTHLISNSDMDYLCYTFKLKDGINYIHLSGLSPLYQLFYMNNNGVNLRRLKQRNTIIYVV